MTTTFNCSFKVLRLECPALVNGASYRITYRRGNTTGATPPLKSDSGVLTVQMEEATALLHFKPSGASHPRFYKKYITFTIEESYSPRREVGTVEFDVAGCLQPGQNACRVVRQASFRMGGFGACIDVLVILYPEGSVPPAEPTATPTPLTLERSETIAPLRPVVTTPTTGGRGSASSSSNSVMKSLSRDEGMLLLLSVEELIEKRGAPAATKYDTKLSEEALAKKVAELEKRVLELKHMTTPQEILKGASREAAKAELESYAMRRMNKLRQTPSAVNFRSAVASTLTSLAEGTEASGQSVEAKIQSVRQDIAQLHAEQDNLGKLQLHRDVTNELIVNLERLDTKEKQLSKLLAQKEPNLLSTSRDKVLSVETVKSDIAAAQRSNAEKQQQLRDIEHALAEKLILWATRLAAPLRQTASISRDLEEEQRTRKEEQQKKEQEQRRQQLADLFAPAAPAELNSSSAAAVVASSSPQANPSAPPSQVKEPTPDPSPAMRPVDLMAELYKGLPSASDFKTEESVVKRPVVDSLPHYDFGSEAASEVRPERRVDPFSDLRNAFEPSVMPASRAPPAARTDMPKYNFADDDDDDSAGGAAAGGGVAAATATGWNTAASAQNSMPKYDWGGGGTEPNSATKSESESRNQATINWNDSFDATKNDAISYEF